MENFVVSLVIFTCVYAIFGLGLNLQWGYTGLLNFGHVAFMTVGAYTTVLLTLGGVPLAIAALIGGALAALLGLLIGISTLRLRTDYLAIVTIGVAEVIRLIAVNEEWLTRGTFGIQKFPLPLANLNPGPLGRLLMVAILTTVLGLAYWQLWRWLRQTLKPVLTALLVRGAIAAFLYLGTLGAAIYGIGAGAKFLKSANLLPPWVLGLLLLGAVIGLGWLYITLSQQLTKRIPAWSSGLTLVSSLVCVVLGTVFYGYGASALYHYEQNPSKNGLMLISVVLVAVLYWGLERLGRSPWGRVLKAVREDEDVAKAMGKNVFWYKLQALMLGGFCAGVAGALYAWQITTVYPDNFMPLITFNAWTIIVLGGAGSNLGTILGAAIFWGYDSITRFVLSDIVPLGDAKLGAFRVMVIGLILMLLMVWRPQGLLGNKDELTLGR
jgi:neutral amino acid transport system permease protein